MQPIVCKISRLGGSACITIPLTLARMYEWAPGAVVRAKLVEGGALFEKEVRELFAGRSSGIIVPKDYMEAHDLEIGDEVAVPFYEWVTVKGVAWKDPSEKRGPSKKRALKH